MIKHYVGARYVPKFASPLEWAADTSYEALTIVTFNNASYTSKVPVPPIVGDPADNPDYWALTGNYNAQVDQYRQETETVSNNLTTEITNRKNVDNTLQAEFDELSENKADIIVSSASGSIASFPDGAARLVDDLTVQIEPVQEGTGDPSPDNVRPITGWTGAKVTRTGKNLFRLGVSAKTISVNGITVTPYNDVSVMVNGTNTAGNINVQLDFGSWGNAPFSLKKQASNYKITYSVKIKGTISGTYDFYGGYIDKNGTAHQFVISPSTLVGTSTIPADAIRLRTWFNILPGASASNAIIEIQAELGSTATDHEPYQGSTYPVTFPTEAGTVYGGTLDVTSGVLTVDRAMVQNSAMVNRYEKANNYYWYTTADELTVEGIASLNAGLISNRLKADINVTPTSQDGIITWYGNNIIRWKEQRSLTLDEYRDYLASNPLQLVYELATPITYHLTPQEITTLLGQNNIWADTGDTSVTYRADTKLYIDKKFTELQALILEN